MLRFGLLNLFMISYFLHLSARIPQLAALHVDLALGCVILLLILAEGRKEAWRFDALISSRLYLFFAYVVLSLPFVTWPGSVVRFHLVEWLKLVMFFVFVVTTVKTPRQLKILLAVFLGCQLVRILEPLQLHLTTGYWGDVAYSRVGEVTSVLNRLSGAPDDVVNPNQLAWVVVTILPFLYYLLWKGSLAGKLSFLLLTPACLWVLLLTGSRSGMICLAVVILAILLLDGLTFSRLAGGALVILPLGVFSLARLSPELQTRYLSLVDSGVAGADTARARIDGVLNQLGSLAHNPLFGNGLGTSRETNWNIVGGSSQITHNLYVEILQETGLFGFTLFTLFVVAIIQGLRSSRRRLAERDDPEADWLRRLASALLVWLAMNLVYGLSCFGLSSWEWYLFGGLSLACCALAGPVPALAPGRRTAGRPLKSPGTAERLESCR